MTTQQDRFRLTRGGVLNVWQYDRQTFEFAGGRLLLRGANGAGKSKTMEMLLPFVLDGDKARLTASGKHHTSLLWLMLDGHEGNGRTGYVWVEFCRMRDGRPETVTCGVGMRATQAARTATSWFFTSPRRVGHDLALEDESGPLSHQRLKADIEADGVGRVFDKAKRYREHVGQLLFGLPVDQYDELLRLLYWLRQPQVGEDIDPKRLAEQLVNALPQVDDAAIRSAGDTFDELEEFGEQLERRTRASEAITSFLTTYRDYARCVVADRADRVLEADAQMRTRRRTLRLTQKELADASTALEQTDAEREREGRLADQARSRITALESGPEARTQQRLVEMGRTAEALQRAAAAAEKNAAAAMRRTADAESQAADEERRLARGAAELHDGTQASARLLVEQGVSIQLAELTSASPLASHVPVEDARAVEARGQVLRHSLTSLRDWVAGCGRPVGERRAAVQVVRDAVSTSEAARDAADRAEEEVARAEASAENAATSALSAERESRRRELELGAALSAWLGSEHAVPFELPALTSDGLVVLEQAARTAAAPDVRRWADLVGRAHADLDDLGTVIRELHERRRAVEAEIDPAPALPLWRRDAREGRPGEPFWKLVDFRPEVSASDRAGVEAALEGAGILDAWVEPDGRVSGGRLDALLSAAERADVPSRSLLSVLRPDLQASGVDPSVTSRLLARLRLREAGDADAAADASDGAAVGVDGSWRVGPVVGRTTKDVAQYVGASARAAERLRRLEGIDAQLTASEVRRRELDAVLADATRRLQGLEFWLSERPRHDALLVAWATSDACEAALAERRRELEQASRVATAARTEASARHTELVELAATLDLPTTAEGLQVREDTLSRLSRTLADHDRAAGRLTGDVERWERMARLAVAEAVGLVDARAEAATAEAAHRTAAAERGELARAEGASLAELDRRLGELRAELAGSAARRKHLDGEHDRLTGEVGKLGSRVEGEERAVQEAEPALERRHEAFARLSDVPGVLAAAGVVHDDGSPLLLAGLDAERTKGVRAALGTGLPVPEAAKNAVYQGNASLQSGPAATNEPRVVEQDGVLVSVGRDDTGDVPLVELDRRLAASIAQDRELLTAQERELFERHILGQLGDALRSVRIKASELVTAMNAQLHGVTTSQGIRVQLKWRLRDDIPVEARRAVELLKQPLGALLPDERSELRGALHDLISASRVEAPEESYATHLARALDYRRWYAFAVQYHRPETGEWRDLQRKSALSQGEQKVLCYLPLFAAAAAHFASLAGAAPHAPRFVILDDAFPKIDTRTHPLLFGLLVDLDLDFLITSERLWGTHATVPELAIYEALRSPSERGIAQYQHRWDGQRLTSVGG